MHTLVLMRHAKSDYPAGVADHDRPLAARGAREAALAGNWLRANAPRIEHVLCSSAARTRETLARSRIDAPVSYLEQLYGAMPGTVIDEVNAVDESVGTLLVIGHEPTISHLALGLADASSSNATAAEHISNKFPTSGIAVLRTSGTWSQLELASAALITFHVPR